ncbi:hypothetical protein [Lysobacter sp.]|uniref:hypothetical protein n=1 Tax=Lysobacter sp. TaxID=72226 RepID=UPI002D55C76B|nr:hypothetical protein [Lysobacter sp.]HZX79208.1 hypothetical protein [Lysobacter sp.]
MRTLKVIAIGIVELAVLLPAYYVVAPLLFRANLLIPPDTWLSFVILLVCSHVGVMLRAKRPVRVAG